VCDDLEKSTDTKDVEHCDTLEDVKSACGIAVEILNDLLCFDKLESGILEMHKHDVPAVSFIADCVNMFASQAREAGVKIYNISNGTTEAQQALDPKSHSTATCLLESDTVFMDKFKMDQVLRNLISNALKFTPRGGFVTVSASFVPENTEESSPPLSHSPTEESLFRGTIAGRNREKKTLPRFLSKWLPFRRNSSWLSHYQIASSGVDDVEAPMDHTIELVPYGEESTSSNPERFRRVGGSSVDRGNPCVDKRGDMWDRGEDYSRTNSMSSINGESIDGALQLNIANSARNVTAGRGSEMTCGKLRIVVTDTGAGISEENQSRLFKEIVQFNPEVLQAGGGSGLGLYITSSIVQMHAGTIRAYSAGAGKGSTFTVEIDMHRWASSSPDNHEIDLLNATSLNADRAAIHNWRMARRAEAGSHSSDNREGRPDFSGSLEVAGDNGNWVVGQVPCRLPPSPKHAPLSPIPMPISIPVPLPVPRFKPTPVPVPVPTLYLDDTPSPCSCSDSSPIPNPHSTSCTCATPLSTAPPPPPPPPSVPTPAVVSIPSSIMPPASCPPAVHKETDTQNGSVASDKYDVLVVDDSSLNRKLLCRVLKTSGYTCEEADDGLNAVQRVKDRMDRKDGNKPYYDIILMDFVMPNMDGPTATQAIRSLGYTAPIFGLTGNALDSDVSHFLKCGVKAVLPKPFDLARFKELMKAV
jgi:signal transduction histidine kinase/ActR/RegA family two-component response regulator